MTPPRLDPVETMSRARLNVCRTCPSLARRLQGTRMEWWQCRECWCVLAAKSRVPKQRCPLGKW